MMMMITIPTPTTHLHADAAAVDVADTAVDADSNVRASQPRASFARKNMHSHTALNCLMTTTTRSRSLASVSTIVSAQRV